MTRKKKPKKEETTAQIPSTEEKNGTESVQESEAQKAEANDEASDDSTPEETESGQARFRSVDEDLRAPLLEYLPDLAGIDRAAPSQRPRLHLLVRLARAMQDQGVVSSGEIRAHLVKEDQDAVGRPGCDLFRNDRNSHNIFHYKEKEGRTSDYGPYRYPTATEKEGNRASAGE